MLYTTNMSPALSRWRAGKNRSAPTRPKSKSWATVVGPAVDTWTSREQGRTPPSPGGVQASFPPVHKTPFCQTALRKRSSLVSIEPAAVGWSAFGGCEVLPMDGSDSAQARVPFEGSPVSATTPIDGYPALHPE